MIILLFLPLSRIYLFLQFILYVVYLYVVYYVTFFDLFFLHNIVEYFPRIFSISRDFRQFRVFIHCNNKTPVALNSLFTYCRIDLTNIFLIWSFIWIFPFIFFLSINYLFYSVLDGPYQKSTPVIWFFTPLPDSNKFFFFIWGKRLTFLLIVIGRFSLGMKHCIFNHLFNHQKPTLIYNFSSNSVHNNHSLWVIITSSYVYIYLNPIYAWCLNYMFNILAPL